MMIVGMLASAAYSHHVVIERSEQTMRADFFELTCERQGFGGSSACADRKLPCARHAKGRLRSNATNRQKNPKGNEGPQQIWGSICRL